MIYVHVPFCRSFCTYCDFYSEVVGGCRPAQAAGGEGLVAFSGENATNPGLQAGVSSKNGRFCDQPQREAALFGRYTDDLCAEIRSRRDEILAASGVRTLYIGGGTPSVLPLDCLRRIVEKVREVEGAALADGADGPAQGEGPAGADGPAGGEDPAEADVPTRADGDWEEFTVEVNPEDIVERGPSYVEGLLELGVNRISMGVQSLDDGMLRWMNRRHSADGARKAWQILTSVRADLQKVPKMTVPPSENVGVPSKSAENDGRLNRKGGEPFRDRKGGEPYRDREGGEPFRERGLSLSVDLISGVPGMDCAMLERTLNEVLEWRPEHISAYQLSVEEGSALARMIADGRVAELPDEECRAQYELVCQKLGAAGYHHYEISNWALPGHEAVHNSAYWTRQPYVGLGPGAHSLEITATRQIRKWNSRRPTGWGEEGREVLTAEEIREETLMLLARTDRGPIPERDWFVADELIPDLL